MFYDEFYDRLCNLQWEIRHLYLYIYVSSREHSFPLSFFLQERYDFSGKGKRYFEFNAIAE